MQSFLDPVARGTTHRFGRNGLAAVPMNAEYHRRLRLDDYRTLDEYLRERIRRGLQAHHDHTEMLLHLQDQYREAYKRYMQELAQRDRPER